MSSLAWGVLSLHCEPILPFVLACVGCDASPSVALLDMLPSSGHCPGVSFVHAASALLPSWVYSLSNLSAMAKLGREIPDFNYRYYKLRLLFELMLRDAPKARWLIKADLDAWLNLDRLARILSLRWEDALHSGRPRADYIGRPMRTWAHKRSAFTFIQGGAVTLSRRGARALAACMQPLGAAGTRCPNSELRRVPSRPGATEYKVRNAEFQRDGCFSTRTIAYNDDTYAGLCLHKARVTLGAEPCFLTHTESWAQGVNGGGGGAAGGVNELNYGATSHEVKRSRRKQLGRCGCPVSEHPLKTEAMLHASRDRHLECCARAEVVKTSGEQETRGSQAVGGAQETASKLSVALAAAQSPRRGAGGAVQFGGAVALAAEEQRRLLIREETRSVSALWRSLCSNITALSSAAFMASISPAEGGTGTGGRAGGRGAAGGAGGGNTMLSVRGGTPSRPTRAPVGLVLREPTAPLIESTSLFR